jgi:hypothetical protein
MRDLATLFVHLIWTVFRLLSPGGARSVVAESMLLKHQLPILNRSREQAPDLRPTDLRSAITRSRPRGRRQVFVMHATRHRCGAHPVGLLRPTAGEWCRGRHDEAGRSCE